MKATGEEGSVWGRIAMCLIKCADCCLACIEKIVDYINNAAFAYMAICGDNFCKSAWNGMLLNTKWAASFSAAKFFATSLIFLGKAAITVLNVFTCYFLIGAMMEEGASRDGPAVVVGMMTWFSCEIWLSIFDKAILGVMTSLAVDTDVMSKEKDENGEPRGPCRGPATFNNKRAVFDAPTDDGKGVDPTTGANRVSEGGEYYF